MIYGQDAVCLDEEGKHIQSLLQAAIGDGFTSEAWIMPEELSFELICRESKCLFLSHFKVKAVYAVA